jgi:hypothetical protein
VRLKRLDARCMARKSKSDNGYGSQCMVSDVGGYFGFWMLVIGFWCLW